MLKAAMAAILVLWSALHNSKLVQDYLEFGNFVIALMNISTTSIKSSPVGFSVDFWNISQSEYIIGHGSHFEFPIGTKKLKLSQVPPYENKCQVWFQWDVSEKIKMWNFDGTQSDDKSSHDRLAKKVDLKCVHCVKDMSCLNQILKRSY